MTEAEKMQARIEAQEKTIDRLLGQIEDRNEGIRNQQKKIEELRAWQEYVRMNSKEAAYYADEYMTKEQQS